MDENIKKRLVEEYNKILYKKLELIFNLEPDQDEKTSIDTSRTKKLEYDVPIFDVRYEDYGPHGDYTKTIICYEGKDIFVGLHYDEPYPIGNGLYVFKDAIYDKDAKLVKSFIDICNKHVTVEKFRCGYSIIHYSDYWFNIMDSNLNCISEKGFCYARQLSDKYFLVKTAKGYNVIDTNGRFLLKKFCKYEDDICFSDCILNGKDEIVPLITEYGNYSVKKRMFMDSYLCRNKDDEKDVYDIKYQPLRMYGIRFCLCLNYEDKCIYMYDKFTDNYTRIGNAVNVKYSKDNDFILEEFHTYMVYEDNFIDISDFYFKNLRAGKAFSIRKGIPGPLMYDDFCFDNMEETRRIIKEEMDKYSELKEKVRLEDEQKKIEKAKEDSIRKEKEKKGKKKEILLQLKSLVETLENEYSQDNDIERVEISNIFINVGDHIEINPMFINILKFIDLRVVSFTNVKMSNIDFRDTNIEFDPQLVYNKDLSGSNFEGLYIGPFMNFKGVNIKGCKFSEDNNPNTDDYLNLTFKDSIFDETTTYNGTPLTELIKNKTR